jgi:uncharacterized protein YceH (UPF0502 family)
MTRPDGPFVAKLPREPGRRESRYMQLFSGEAPPPSEDAAGGSGRPDGIDAGSLADRVAALEAEVARLQQAIEALKHPS